MFLLLCIDVTDDAVPFGIGTCIHEALFQKAVHELVGVSTDRRGEVCIGVLVQRYVSMSSRITITTNKHILRSAKSLRLAPQ
jgi:hypothetical protein